jgi:nucleoside-diphosphate-sugar epimerase
MSSVLLFGTGQIGVFAARALAQRGARVHAADAAPDGSFYARFGPGADAWPPIKVDVTCTHEVEGFIRSYPESEAVVLAAGYTGARAAADPVTAKLVAERGVVNLFAAARASGIRRAVVVSSLAVYGGVVEGDRLAVDGPTQPRTAYGEIQLALEDSARRFVGDLDVAILRIAGVFGPQRFGYGSHSSRFVERMLYAAAIGHPVRIEGYWEDEDDLIYVKDVGEAISAAALTLGTGSFTVNVGLGRVSTLREIADGVLGVFPTADIAVTPPLQLQEPRRRLPLDSASLVARLGVRPAFSLTAAIRDYASETGLV